MHFAGSIFDEWVGSFLPHAEGAVVGNWRSSIRASNGWNGLVHWFGLDLAEVVEYRRMTLTGQVLDPDWLTTVRQRPGPYFFVAEAVLISGRR